MPVKLLDPVRKFDVVEIIKQDDGTYVGRRVTFQNADTLCALADDHFEKDAEVTWNPITGMLYESR